MAEIYGLVQLFDDEGAKAGLTEELRQRFLEVMDPQTGMPLFADVLDGDQVYSGGCSSQVDLVLVPQDGWTVLRRFADNAPVVREPTGLAGTHRPQGILIAAGPNVRSDSQLVEAQLIDLAPTILHWLEGAVPEDMDGRVLSELLHCQRRVEYSQSSAPERIVGQTLSAEDAQALESRLRALGYLG
jgi:predicted AlkP superfamily phosphohydrolase/phosphomutase